MKKIKKLLLASVCLLGLAGCGAEGEGSSSPEASTIKGTPDLNSAVWTWEEDASGGYVTTLYLTYSDGQNGGAEHFWKIVPEAEVLTEATCVEDGLIRYTARFDANGVRLESHKDVAVPAKGHQYVSYHGDEQYHYPTCACGKVDYSQPAEHVFADDGNGMTESCSLCRYSRFNSEYLENKIPNAKKQIAGYETSSTLEEALSHIAINQSSSDLANALTEEDCARLTSEERAKLLSVLYDYSLFLNAGDYHSYKFSLPAVFDYSFEERKETDPEYGTLSCIDLPASIPVRSVNIYPDGHIDSRPDNGIAVDYQATVYNGIEIPSFPAISDSIQEIGFMLYVPTSGIEYRILSYKSFPSSLGGDNRTYLNEDTPLQEGWNFISFSDFAPFKDKTHLFLEIKDSGGSMPKGVYKMSSMLAKYGKSEELLEDIASLASLDLLSFQNFEQTKNAFALYSRFNDSLKKLVPYANKLEELHQRIEGKFSLPYGSSITVTDNRDLSTAMPLSKIEGNSMYQLNLSSTFFKGTIKASDPIPCPNQTLGFLTYQQGETYFGADADDSLSLLDVYWNSFVETVSVPLGGGWVLHYVPLDRIEEYVEKGAETIYSSNFIRFQMTGIALSLEYPLYLSTLYSFDTSLLQEANL